MLRLDDEASSGLEASAAAGLSPSPMAAFAVALKLPDFWLHNPPPWFVHIEAQFSLRGVSADDTKYHHVVASLDPLSTRRVMTLLWDPQPKASTPPSRRCCCGVTPSLMLSGPRNSFPSRAWATAPLSSSWRACCPCWARMTEDFSSPTSFSDSCRLQCALDLPTPRYWPRRITAPLRKRQIASSWLPGVSASRRLFRTHQRFLPPPHQCSRGPPTRPQWPESLHGGTTEKGFAFITSVLERRHGAVSRLAVSRPRETGMSALCSSRDRWQQGKAAFLRGLTLGEDFLVDSGSQKSLLLSGSDRLAEGCGPLLTAANGSPIKTFGERLVTVCFHDRDFQWNFVVAASSVPIIGADFLCAHGLLVDVANRCLIDAVSFSSLPCLTWGAQPVVHANSVDSGDVFQCLLSEFPSLTVPTFSSTVTKHGVEHYITTVGPPVFARARRLDPAKLAVAREEFATMERLGIVQRSNSAWASPLHMVPKSDGRWQPCGDFRRLNNVTQNDRYCIPHIQDFSAHLAGTSVFSKIDLVRGYRAGRWSPPGL
ncbi:uncharacterized protein LOC112846992 isoform X1 [Oreochromis niloticus]|uniref:uncharacterized protein LOC112846992 isoform X1 n=1 Tax=Oreochromis niloticus TaxID=8128 RepID=UPI000DF4C161|nr:uncharacterized protein LOC112846992 isoform X1 [Oreochromis niloticus]